jgi:hypothetical protein
VLIINKIADHVESDDQVLSDFHRDFLIRYMEYESRRQELVSDRFLRERKLRADDVP